MCELRRHAYNDTVDSGTVKTLLDKIFPACRCPEQGQSQQTLPTPSPDSTHSPPTLSLPRSCRGHERVISIEETGRSLDINEECIATFLCYLEQQNWLKIISVFNDTCTLSWSGGETQLKAMRDKVRAVDEAIKFVGNGKIMHVHNYYNMHIVLSYVFIILGQPQLVIVQRLVKVSYH